MIQQYHSWGYTQTTDTGYSRGTCTPMFIVALFTIAKLWKQPRCPTTDKWIRKCGIYTQWTFMQPRRRMKCYHLLVNGWNWRTSFWVRLAWPKRPKLICSPSYADIRSRANTARRLGFDHETKGRAHKGGMRIGKTPKKLDCICCPHRRETKADTLKQLRPIGEGDQELE
jgi:hypothetical protein